MNRAILIAMLLFSQYSAADIFDVISTVASGGGNPSKHKTAAGNETLRELRPLASATSPSERLDIVPKVADKHLLGWFYQLSTDGTMETLNSSVSADGFAIYELEPQRLVLTKPIYRAGNLSGIADYMQQEYVSAANSDALAKQYVAQARKRGNTVKQYRSPLNIEVNKAVEKATGFFVKYSSSKGIDATQDAVLIETAPDGGIVSILSRNHQVYMSLGAESHIFAQLIYGRRTIDAFENLVTYEKMRDMYLRDL